MSLIIKDIEIPNDCHTCRFRNDTWCIAAQRYLQEYTVNCFKGIYCREKDCPFGEALTPHGRLIDADALNKKAVDRSEKLGALVNVLDKVLCSYDIQTAPTIIPASERE